MDRVLSQDQAPYPGKCDIGAAALSQLPPTRTLIDEYLAEQQRLQTPVARFAQSLAQAQALAPATRYRDLIPLSAPQPGEQYAFEVDLDACTGCKACVAGCHSMNGLDEGETWRDVGLLIGGSAEHPFQQAVTTACHHCADPACLNGCPVLAYEKDPLTGIVRHLDDQCIGCQYCVLKCPYDVPKYNERLGIVRKCDLCHSRLNAGEAPACVQACPTQAIRVITVAQADIAAASRQPDSFLPGAPEPGYTQPSTRYRTKRPTPSSLIPADAAARQPEPAHHPLAVMLVLTQLGVGLLASDVAFGRHADHPAWLALALFAVGLVASVAHLGRPERAWRIFLNAKKSWLSREALVFGAALPFVVLFSLRPFFVAAGLAAAGLGLAGVFCSAMIYIDTRRQFWRWPVTGGKFFATTLLGVLAFAAPPWAAAVLGIKVAGELRSLRSTASRRSARLLRGPLRSIVIIRSALAVAAASLLALGYPLLAFAPLALGELAERSLFFRAVDAPKMPGGVAA